MRGLMLIGLAMGVPQPLLAEPGDGWPRQRFAASLPCAPGFLPMAWQTATVRPRPDKAVPPPPPRRDPPRRPACLRLAAT